MSSRDVEIELIKKVDDVIRRIIIVSGLSGAGKTVALRSLEDSDYFCIDNLPVVLVEPFITTIKNKDIKKIGIGVDIREKEFLLNAYQILSSLKRQYRVEVLFLEAEKEVILRRYKETRRPHPMLIGSRAMDIDGAIEQERVFLATIRNVADKTIDTSSYTPHQLRHLIASTYGNCRADKGINISLISFGYKFGLPQDLDLLFDVRFLLNPYFIPELKPLRGVDVAVSDFVLRDDNTRVFLSHITRLLDFLVPCYTKEGRAYLVVGIGCTGGLHRSPAIVEEIARQIEQTHGIKPTVIHRDMR
ncbi:RNase adapter RapZ [Thermodesulfovibrionales bacterium]|nr:RNase adapter RapZ [Thermodesulfovibrionales bacterium]MCL0105827.1 RNase adapter RapZ [Thermodesulfovibrionales bacterium]